MTTSCLAKKIIFKQNSKIIFIDNAYRPSTCKIKMPMPHYNFFRYYEPDAGTTRAQQRYRARTGVCPDRKRGLLIQTSQVQAIFNKVGQLVSIRGKFK